MRDCPQKPADAGKGEEKGQKNHGTLDGRHTDKIQWARKQEEKAGTKAMARKELAREADNGERAAKAICSRWEMKIMISHKVKIMSGESG